jgi:hypothetical protein
MRESSPIFNFPVSITVNEPIVTNRSIVMSLALIIEAKPIFTPSSITTFLPIIMLPSPIETFLPIL